MNETDLSKGEELCKECGLCCQGVFHTFAYLFTDDDLKHAKNAKIPIKFNNEVNENTFTLPCPSFDSSCSIYNNRPSVCGGHKCDLLKSLISDNIALDDALNKVSGMKSILNYILPILKNYTGNSTSNKPEYLMNKILNNLETESAKNNFKQENKILFMKYGIFYFLKDKYFYKCSTDSKK